MPCHTPSKGGRGNPKVEIPGPRVTKGPEADCCVVQIVASPPVPQPVEQAPATCFQSRSPRVNVQSSVDRPNYISQDEGITPPP
jgi:hypothetical protein